MVSDKRRSLLPGAHGACYELAYFTGIVVLTNRQDRKDLSLWLTDSPFACLSSYHLS